MRPLIAKIKPTGGFSHLFHLALNVLLPTMLFILVRLDFIQLALALILLSKWRMFAVRPRFWLANIRANAVDLTVSISLLIFLIHASDVWWQLLWAVVYGTWLLALKPATDTVRVSLQALIGLLFGLMALFSWAAPLYGLVAGAGLICYLAARHFFDNYDEPYAKLLSYLWGYFGAALTWVLGHWLLFYGGLAQPTLLLVVIAYGFAAIYYFSQIDRLTSFVKRQFIFIMLAIILVVLIFSDWGNKIV